MMKLVSIFLVVCILQFKTVHTQLIKPQPNKLSEDGRLKFLGLAAKYGFPGEQENITTEDGYILTLFHIPGNASQPVLLVHGNTATSDCWITRGNSSLAITLASRGYDVWAINLRGTRYSRKHVFLDPDLQPDLFFDYSFYELAIYDMPATIDFILQKTKQKQLTAIGHSMGTTLLYILGAERPEYNDKIKLGISLAPISFIQNVRGLAALMFAFGPELIDLATIFDFQELLSYEKTTPLLQLICLQPFGYELCIKLALFSVLGKDAAGFEAGFDKTFFGHFPGGTSWKILKHFIQVARSKKFRNYDYGTETNLAVYQSSEPPIFDLGKVRMNTALFVGKEDFMATVADAELLKASLPNVVHYQVLPYESFNHADFIWGRYMPDNLYPFLFKVMDDYK